MREIKFRLWNPERKCITGGNQLNTIIATTNNDFVVEFEKLGMVWMQYTGLKDNNGKEIYEGDIVKVMNKGVYNGQKVVVFDDTILCYVLVWSDLFKDWEGVNSGTTYLKVSTGIKCEIIGNIYENKDLCSQPLT